MTPVKRNAVISALVVPLFAAALTLGPRSRDPADAS